jgi:GxxExxY protein
MNEIVCADECYKIIGACFEVCKEKGRGFLDAVFRECLELELQFQNIPGAAQFPLAPACKGHPLKQRYVADFVCCDKIALEVKAVEKPTGEHRAQVLNYPNATGKRLGLLVNFGHHPKLEWERIVL